MQDNTSLYYSNYLGIDLFSQKSCFLLQNRKLKYMNYFLDSFYFIINKIISYFARP